MKRRNGIINTVKSHKVVSLIVAALVVVGGVGTAVAFYPDSEPKKAAVVTSQQPQEASTPVEETTPVVQEQTPAPVEQEPAPQPVANPFEQGSNAWHVFSKRTAIGKTMPDGNTNYAKYCSSLVAAAYSFSATPTQSAIACSSKGHVMFVEQVNGDGTIWVSEMNSKGQVSISDSTAAGGWGIVDYKLVPADHVTTYKFVE